MLGGVGEVVEGAIGDEAAARLVLEALDLDLALEDAALVLGDQSMSVRRLSSDDSSSERTERATSVIIGSPNLRLT